MLKITEISKDKTVLQLSIQELEVFIAALEEVVFSIYLQEFHARIGVYREEVQDLKELMKKALLIHRMKKDTLNSKNSFELSFDQFITLSQCISLISNRWAGNRFSLRVDRFTQLCWRSGNKI
jgi:uncharacterized small protein (DUF1192 family)